MGITLLDDEEMELWWSVCIRVIWSVRYSDWLLIKFFYLGYICHSNDASTDYYTSNITNTHLYAVCVVAMHVQCSYAYVHELIIF